MERTPSLPRRPAAATGPTPQAGGAPPGIRGPASPFAAAAAGRFQRHLSGEALPGPGGASGMPAPSGLAGMRPPPWTVGPCTEPGARDCARGEEDETPEAIAPLPSGPIPLPEPFGGWVAVDAWPPASGPFRSQGSASGPLLPGLDPEPAGATPPPDTIAPRLEPVPPPGIAAQPDGRRGDGEPRREREERGPRGMPGAGTASPPGGAPAWLQDTVQRIAWLCFRADPAFQSWSVTVPMDPAVLPDSEVLLSLSPYAMHLRFRTGSPEAAHLISLHRDPLRAQLEALGPGQRGIDIDLEPLP